jgi:hypothetical protein
MIQLDSLILTMRSADDPGMLILRIVPPPPVLLPRKEEESLIRRPSG